MSNGLETVEVIEPWLHGLLAGDPQIIELVGDRVVGPLTPYSLDSPYVMHSMTSPRDIRGIGTARIMVEALYTVKAVVQTSSQDDATPLASRIEFLLDGARADTAAGSLTCIRDRIVSYPESVQGVPWLHLGGVYRILAHSS